MNATIFYILGACAVSATLLAVTRRELVHVVVYLVMSFFSFSLIFYMMGAPLIAALEVIVYAGAIMVLFLFIIMMLEMGKPQTPQKPFIRVWFPVIALGLVILISSVALFVPGSDIPAHGGFISPRTFGQALYSRHMIAVEAASLLLLFALVGALYLGRRD